jgi:hypothetical protein
MAVDHVKAAAITVLDTSPPVGVTAGKGAPANLRSVDDYVTLVASSSVDATYQVVRIPSTAKVKSVTIESEAQTAGKVDVGLYYATDGEGGKPTALLAAAAISQAFFASAVDLAAAVVPTDITNESGTYTIGKRSQPIWQAAGLSADPGGMFDVCLTVVTTAVTTGTGKTLVRVAYAE